MFFLDSAYLCICSKILNIISSNRYLYALMVYLCF